MKTMTWTSVPSVCPKCGKPNFYVGDIPDEGIDGLICQCARFEKIAQDLLAEHDEVWRRLANMGEEE